MKGQLHIAVDAHNLLHDRRGIGVYARAMLMRLGQRPDVRLTLLVRELFPGRFSDAIAKEVGHNNFRVSRGIPRKAHVVWHPWNGTFFSSGRHRAVATIHDVAPFAFPAVDESLRNREQLPFLRSAGSTHVVTDSAFSRDQIVEHLQIDPARITVVPLAADPRFGPGEPSSLGEGLRERPYILSVGADDERKNLDVLARAHRAAFPGGDVELICVTKNAPEGATAMPDVRFEVLRDLYRGATAFAMPSVYEGFGIPPLEAMRCGAPVVASLAASLPEVCGDAALYVDEPRSVEAWRGALARIVTDGDLRVRLRERGSERAQQFTWNRTADETLAVLRAAAT